MIDIDKLKVKFDEILESITPEEMQEWLDNKEVD